MADAADFATDLVAEKLEQGIRAARAPIPVGEPGECVSVFHNLCGRRTIRKPCTCETCVAIEHSGLSRL